jgi:hypothetical protein
MRRKEDVKWDWLRIVSNIILWHCDSKLATRNLRLMDPSVLTKEASGFSRE